MPTQITLTSELQAINTMLSIIGEAPVSSITENLGADISIAKQILDESAVDIQSKGWNFNTEEAYPLALNSDSKVPVPTNCVWLTTRSVENQNRVVIRNGFLYVDFVLLFHYYLFVEGTEAHQHRKSDVLLLIH